MDAMPGPNPFKDPTYYTLWQRTVGPLCHVRDFCDDLLVYPKRLPLGLELRELKFCGATTAWFHDLSPRQATTLLDSPGQWDTLRYSWAKSRRALQALDTLKAAGCQMFMMPDEALHIVDLSNGYEAFMASKNAKARYNINQKFKLAAQHTLRLELISEENEIEPFLEVVCQHHIPYWIAKTGHSFLNVPQEKAFYIAWAKDLLTQGKLRLQRFYISETLANLTISIVEGDTMYWLLTVNTGEYENLYPGILSLYERIREAEGLGTKTFNMGPGDFPYKVQAASHAEPRYATVIANPKSIAGQAHWHLMHYKARKQGRLVTG